MKSIHKKSAAQKLIHFLEKAEDRMEGLTEDEVMKLVRLEIKALRKRIVYSS
jgi:hypothetical protein